MFIPLEMLRIHDEVPLPTSSALQRFMDIAWDGIGTVDSAWDSCQVGCDIPVKDNRLCGGLGLSEYAFDESTDPPPSPLLPPTVAAPCTLVCVDDSVWVNGVNMTCVDVDKAWCDKWGDRKQAATGESGSEACCVCGGGRTSCAQPEEGDKQHDDDDDDEKHKNISAAWPAAACCSSLTSLAMLLLASSYQGGWL